MILFISYLIKFFPQEWSSIAKWVCMYIFSIYSHPTSQQPGKAKFAKLFPYYMKDFQAYYQNFSFRNH